jgi:enhancing lycopene biosynthesis protein 2
VASANEKTAAVLLAGCGVNDGTEITEAVSMLIHLSANGWKYKCFAPNRDQMHVVNHVLGQEVKDQKRNIMEESARIARGAVSPITDLSAKDFDALFVPGGFGVAKNLCNFAQSGSSMTVETDVESVLKDFHSSKKPIALSCIAPVLAAKVITGCSVTCGLEADENGEWPYTGATKEITKMGSQHVAKGAVESHVDRKNKIVTTPAYMHSGTPASIHNGIGSMVKAVWALLK